MFEKPARFHCIDTHFLCLWTNWDVKLYTIIFFKWSSTVITLFHSKRKKIILLSCQCQFFIIPSGIPESLKRPLSSYICHYRWKGVVIFSKIGIKTAKILWPRGERAISDIQKFMSIFRQAFVRIINCKICKLPAAPLFAYEPSYLAITVPAGT